MPRMELERSGCPETRTKSPEIATESALQETDSTALASNPTKQRLITAVAETGLTMAAESYDSIT